MKRKCCKYMNTCMYYFTRLPPEICCIFLHSCLRIIYYSLNKQWRSLTSILKKYIFYHSWVYFLSRLLQVQVKQINCSTISWICNVLSLLFSSVKWWSVVFNDSHVCCNPCPRLDHTLDTRENKVFTLTFSWHVCLT